MKKEETPLYKMIISIHAPHARSDYVHPLYRRYRVISIHAPHARSDARAKLSHHSIQLFQSTLLMRGATDVTVRARPIEPISIHAPHARSDLTADRMATLAGIISIHAPHARSDRRAAKRWPPSTFQSTLLMRGATHRRRWPQRAGRISIHAPHARSDISYPFYLAPPHISIHAPHARSDKMIESDAEKLKEFQSTLLMRGATILNEIFVTQAVRFQSTLLMRGATLIIRSHASVRRHFNPRSSCEERRFWPVRVGLHKRFQSTLLMRGATGVPTYPAAARKISIHAPHARSDSQLPTAH